MHMYLKFCLYLVGAFIIPSNLFNTADIPPDPESGILQIATNIPPKPENTSIQVAYYIPPKPENSSGRDAIVILPAPANSPPLLV